MTNPLEDAMTERELQQAVTDAAQLYGWRVYHTYDSRRSPSGFPDLVLLRREQLIFVELKRQKRAKISAAQQAWIDELGAVTTISAGFVRPADLRELLDRLA